MNRFRIPEIVIGALVATALWAAFFTVQPKYSGAQEQPQGSARHQTAEVSEAEKADERVARYTLWLTIFTGVLAVSTIGLMYFTWDTSRIAKESLTSLERAFVSYTFRLSIFTNPNKSITSIGVRPVWSNLGKTATKGLYIHASWQIFPGQIPKDFTFPDRLSADATAGDMAFIGPGEEIESDSLVIRADQLARAFSKQGRIYVWGWAEYDDIFKGTKPHRTEFCNELTAIPDPFLPHHEKNDVFKLKIVGRHVGADEECYRKARPRHLRHIPYT